MTPEQEAARRLRHIATILETGGKLLSIEEKLNISSMRGVEITYTEAPAKEPPGLGIGGESLAGNV